MRYPVLNTMDPPAWTTQAAHWRSVFGWCRIVAFVLAAAALITALAVGPHVDHAALRGVLATLGGLLALAAAAFQSAWHLAGLRHDLCDVLAAQQGATRQGGAGPGSLFSAEARDFPAMVDETQHRLVVGAHWRDVATSLPLALLGALGLLACWPQAGTSSALMPLGIIIIIAAFPLLVLERRLTQDAGRSCPEAPALSAILRAVLLLMLVIAIAAMVLSNGFGSAIWALRVVGIVVLAIIAECTIRGLATLFLPSGGPEQVRSFCESLVARLLMLGMAPRQSLEAGFKSRLNIDWSRSWAIAFLRKAMGPAVCILAVIAWALTSLTVLGVNERGVYERMGRPVAVFQPGLRLHLPWPFGIVRRVEWGTLHSLIVHPIDPSNPSGPEEPPAAPIAADAEAPASFDRLWDQVHPSENSYLVPGPGIDRNGLSSEIIDMDLHIVYRIGPEDAQAIDACYTVADPEGTIRSLASTMILHDFSTRTLFGIIGQDRDQLAAGLQRRLQAALDADRSGIEITAVVVDAIHPPTRAAAAYYGVQAAGIDAATEVAEARKTKAIETARAAAKAAASQDAATAAAAEAITKADGDAMAFQAAVAAVRIGGASYTLEHWLQALSKVLAHSQLTIIDHRLKIQGGALIDLRPPPAPRD